MKSRKRAEGFSLLELVVVLAIILVIAAITIPRALMETTDLRLKSSANDVVGLLQSIRSQAVKRNKTIPISCQSGSFPSCTILYADLSSYTGSEANPTVSLGGGVSFSTSPANTYTPVDAAGNNLFTANQPSDRIAFNPRGMPCLYTTSAMSTSCTTGNGFVYYMTATPPAGSPIYVAVEVTPAGKAHVWSYCGTSATSASNGGWCY